MLKRTWIATTVVTSAGEATLRQIFAARENCIAASVNPEIRDSTYFVTRITQPADCLPLAIDRGGLPNQQRRADPLAREAIQNVRKPFKFAGSGARQVGTVGGVNPDLIAFVDERRHIHDQPGFRLGRLGDAAGSGRLQSRLGLEAV